MTPRGATTRPHRTPHGPGGTTDTLLYARPGIIVTVERFTVGRSSWRVAELTHLRTGRGPHDRIAARAVVVTAGMIGGVGLLLGFAGGLHRLTAGAYLILGAVFLVPVLLAVAGDRWRPPAYELWGRRDGTDVLLFTSDDERQFGQVTRALRRAREMHRYGGWENPDTPVDVWRPRR
ncbi:DUF6232 family protein [Micromonospora endolithica]|uniref:Uncharacterized protein n=1 Tax=Micromonospora endolithica TaxID=230091 RepID=A0A3A9Z171_9ACTN|nr:DUF6232 family protein [Micromonospora endolithica]RKN42053.1 hypothetical protein D7223_23195 [Micromonospora endolithica]TWJ26291.1 hypothetical protein JD76_06472 [Micromonospora endolithica]